MTVVVKTTPLLFLLRCQLIRYLLQKKIKTMGGRVDEVFITETIGSGTIPGWVKQKTLKIGSDKFRV